MKRMFSKMKNEGLSEEENRRILNNLREFVAQNPAKVESPFYIPWFTMRQRSVMGLSVFVFLFIITGGTIFAAKNSVPGDTLYPVKILNENIETSIALGNKVNAKVYSSHAISRLDEVEQIVNSYGKLNREIRQEIQNKFEEQAQAAIVNIGKLKGSGNLSEAEEIRASFKSSLAEREKAMVKLLNDTNTETQTKEELSSVISNIQIQIEKADEELSGEVKGDDTQNPEGQATTTSSQDSEQDATTTPATTTPEQDATSTPATTTPATTTPPSTPE